MSSCTTRPREERCVVTRGCSPPVSPNDVLGSARFGSGIGGHEAARLFQGRLTCDDVETGPRGASASLTRS